MSRTETRSDSAQPHAGSGGTDHRRHPRIPWECSAKLRCRDPKLHGVNLGITRDISLGGVRVRAFRSMPIDHSILVDLQCNGHGDPASATGSVVWAAPAKDSQHWEIGIRFTALDRTLRSSIQRRTSGD
jgi:hypothetical protein